MRSQARLIVVGIFVGLAFVLAGWKLFPRPYTFQGSLIDPPVPAAEIALSDQNGRLFRLSDQRGKPVLIAFGYTHCPDVCPATLSKFRQIKQELGSAAQQVQFVLITVDPQRDTPAHLGEYVAYFDPAFIGLSGSTEQLQKVWKDYGVYQQRREFSGETSNSQDYLVDHTALVYLIDRGGNWRLTYPFGMEADKITADLRHLLGPGG